METSLVGEQIIWTVVDFSYGFKFPLLGVTVKRLDLVMSFCGKMNLRKQRRSAKVIKKCTCDAWEDDQRAFNSAQHSLVGDFMLALVFHLEGQFVLLEHSHCSKVQQAVCGRKKRFKTAYNLSLLKIEFAVRRKKCKRKR